MRVGAAWTRRGRAAALRRGGAGLLGIVLSAASAGAQGVSCPAGPAIDGIYAAYGDRIARYELLSDGMTAETEIARDGGFVYEYRSLPVGLVLWSWEMQAGVVAEGSFEAVTLTGVAGDPPPAPRPGVQWSGLEVARFGDGTEIRLDTDLQVGAARQEAFGECAYTVWPITVTRTDRADGTVTRDAFLHLPDLSVTLYVGQGQGTGAIAYDLPRSLSVLPPFADGRVPRIDRK